MLIGNSILNSFFYMTSSGEGLENAESAGLETLDIIPLL
jgi:hypothetical protein